MIRAFFRWIFSFLRWYRDLYRGRSWVTKSLIAFTSLIVSLLLYFGAVDINFLWLFGKSPGFYQIMHPQTSSASEIYSSDGKMIGKFYNENRTPVKYSDINPTFWKALIDTEDERYYSHHGIDFAGLPGAIKDALLRNGARGASTITQQLAKNMFRMRTQYSTGLLGKIPGLRIIIVKTKEWITAIKLEMCYDKHTILEMYANTVDFGSNSFGINTAARTYFNTTPGQLTVNQSATLVGMLKATTYYNPISHPDNCLHRRNVVLQNMVRLGDLGQGEMESMKTQPLQLSINKESYTRGEALYFRDAIARHLREWCDDNGYDLYSSGLKIYTTIDSRMQKYAEQAVRGQMSQIQSSFNSHWGGQEPWRDEKGRVVRNFIQKIAERLPYYKTLYAQFNGNKDSINYYLNKPHRVKLFDYHGGTTYRTMSTMDSIRYMVRFMHCGFLAMEPQTGEIRAWVGDIDYNTWQYDKVTAQRQPGSTFKLFVYTEAMNQGLTPCDQRKDEKVVINSYNERIRASVRWEPHNAGGSFSGQSMQLRQAFARSVNSIAAQLGQDMGIRNIIRTAEDMGIRSKLWDEPSLALGSNDVNLLEMVNAYCTIANDGKHCDPVLVTKIIDRNGSEVYTGYNKARQVLSYRTAFLMQRMLMGGVTEPGGTSRSLASYVGRHSDTSFGGKTGTTNNNSDAWFMGVSPGLVCGAWVGGEYRSIHFRTGALGQGARTALPICGRFLQSVFSDPHYNKYHRTFGPSKEPDISEAMYLCNGKYRDDDYYDNDSTGERRYHDDEYIPEGGDGNYPINDDQYPYNNNDGGGQASPSQEVEIEVIDND
ncbi:MAG: transglycosylase domain-containing protein [Prevotella sp.]|nr:transglycosylase domain-containing protein [Prevotella sp.]